MMTGCRTTKHDTYIAHHHYESNDTLRYRDTTRYAEYYRNDTLVIHEQHTIYRDRVTEVGKTDTIVREVHKVQHTSSPSPLYLKIIITLMAIIIVALGFRSLGCKV